jgi:hypothetical protein
VPFVQLSDARASTALLIRWAPRAFERAVEMINGSAQSSDHVLFTVT